VVNLIKKKLDDKQWEVQGDQKENKSEQALQIIPQEFWTLSRFFTEMSKKRQ
jgi:hypothetical protein